MYEVPIINVLPSYKITLNLLYKKLFAYFRNNYIVFKLYRIYFKKFKLYLNWLVLKKLLKLTITIILIVN